MRHRRVTLSDVDWRGQTISFVQRKTGNPLTVPLTELLVCRLADYVLCDRPRTGDDHVFVRGVAPHVRLEPEVLARLDAIFPGPGPAPEAHSW